MTAVTSIAQQAHTDTLSISTVDFTHLLSTVSFTLLTSATISIQLYVYGLDNATVETQLLIDDTVVADSGAEHSTIFNATLGSGTHTIVYQALAANTGVVAGNRGITVLNLTTGV